MKTIRFYSNHLFRWIFPFILLILVSYLYCFAFKDTFSDIVYISAAALSFVVTLFGFSSWYSQNLSLSEEGIILYNKLFKKRIILWSQIKSIDFDAKSGIISVPVEKVIISYLDRDNSCKQYQAVVSSFCTTYSGKLVFEKMVEIYQCRGFSRSTPQLNEPILYYHSCQSFVFMSILFIIFIIFRDRYSGVFLYIVPIFLMLDFLYIKTKNPLTVTSEGIRGELLYKIYYEIKWEEIKAIKYLEEKRKHEISIELTNPEVFWKNYKKWQIFFIKRSRSSQENKLMITENIKKYALKEVYEFLISEWKHHIK